MSRILFAWELGANLGHLARDLKVAECLRDSGHHVAFAVRDGAVAAQLLHPRGFGFVQAPICPAREGLRRPPANYSEILVADGFGQPDALLGTLKSWSMLFHLSRPDMIVADHAPGALLASRLLGVPAVPMGTGFEIPPQESPFPTIRPWEKIDAARLERADAFLLQRFSKSLVALGGEPLYRLADLFPNPILTTVPELDHYGAREGARYVGSIHSIDKAPSVSWPSGHGRRIFAYLRPCVDGFREALAVLSKLGSPVISVVPGISRSEAARYASPRHKIFEHHVDVGHLLADASVVVSYGGAGIISESLLAGVPLLLLPQNVEQWMGSRRAELLGAALMLTGRRNQEEIAKGISRVLTSPDMRHAARTFAENRAGIAPREPATAAADLIKETLISNRPSDARFEEQ